MDSSRHTIPANTAIFRFNDLPKEMRSQTYKALFHGAEYVVSGDGNSRYTTTAMLRVSRQAREEAMPAFIDGVTLVTHAVDDIVD